MKIAVIGSRGLKVNDLEKYLPKEVTEIVSGGARGIDTCAREYAVANGLKLTEFLPEYEKYGRVAPLRRNLQIIDYADEVLACCLDLPIVKWTAITSLDRYVVNVFSNRTAVPPYGQNCIIRGNTATPKFLFFYVVFMLWLFLGELQNRFSFLIIFFDFTKYSSNRCRDYKDFIPYNEI